VQPDVNLTLPNECYTFTINDSFGDGMFSSAYGFGGYQVLANGTLLSGVSGGNFTSSDTKKFGINTNLGIEDFSKDLVKFYPNPSNGVITISLPETAKISISDLSGKVVYAASLTEGETTININNLSSGVYLINFAGDTFTKTDKIILK
ncbi:MAG: T9SS type A sorting domain-containing protein, partial [Flavobacteriales bacterium]|nr:T9SS type A sorting domain-containing protein [Flavobacteriales bacterium]